MARRPVSGSVQEYIAGFPPKTRAALRQLRAVIRTTVPAVSERISYGIPTFDMRGRRLVYIAGWKEHVGLYPVVGPVADAFEQELSAYKRGKGSVQFPLSEPMPTDLVRRMVAFMVEAAKKG